ncbi:MAG: hypothetical protein GDA42_09440 [Ekhidna sp.]|nr:hypothetical protein [Ekhidna sp.]
MKRPSGRYEIKWSSLLTDNWKSFKRVFRDSNHLIGKADTKGIEGNNCQLRHRIRHAFRQTWLFFKKRWKITSKLLNEPFITSIMGIFKTSYFVVHLQKPFTL